MPVAAFPARHGWGYDGVHLYAVHEPYGGPDGFKRFVDACHARGLGVVLDVVYNHLGPSGNYLPRFGPYFTDRHTTPWGDGVNLDDDGRREVRRWIIDNALMWLRDYHVDGAAPGRRARAGRRLGACTCSRELAVEVDALSAHLRRPLHPDRRVRPQRPAAGPPGEAGGLGLTAQWSDDFHHALHALLTGEGQGYYADFGSLVDACAKTLTGAFFHAGTCSSFRGADCTGAPVDRRRHARRTGSSAYPQNHDQVGNRAVGDRLAATLVAAGLAQGRARRCVLTSPFTPMLFMGEEWAASTPWQYFTSHQEPELAEAVAGRPAARVRRARLGRGRRAGPAGPGDVRRASTLDWSELADGSARRRCSTGTAPLIALRRAEPWLSDPRLDLVSVAYDADARLAGGAAAGRCGWWCNLAAERQAVPLDGTPMGVLLSSGPGLRLPGRGDRAGASVRRCVVRDWTVRSS